MKNIKKIKIFSLLLALCMLFTACSEINNLLRQDTTDYNNTVTMLDVGQASCTLIESDGRFCMIDAGKAGGSTDIVSYLHDRKVKKLDLLVLTHFHYDHTSEALDIIRNFDIGTILIPSLSDEYKPDNYFYQSLIEDAANGYFNLEYASQGLQFTIGSGVLTVLADTCNSENINNTSTAVSYTGDDFVYVNTGDAEADREADLISLLPQNIDFLTAAHHGSRDSNSEEFLKTLSPSFVGISCGKENDYGHPHKAVLDRLADMDIPYAITYETGNIVYSMATPQETNE